MTYFNYFFAGFILGFILGIIIGLRKCVKSKESDNLPLLAEGDEDDIHPTNPPTRPPQG